MEVAIRATVPEQLFCTRFGYTADAIDLLHKSHYALVPYHTVDHFVTEMCPCVHISATKWWDICCLMHFSNSDMGLLGVGGAGGVWLEYQWSLIEIWNV